MAQLLADTAGMLEILAIAAGLLLLHRASRRARAGRPGRAPREI